MPKYTTSDGVSLHYEVRGTGRPVVFIPGICGGAQWWSYQTAALADDFQVLSLDLRGVGRSDRTTHGHRVSRYATDVRELLDHLGWDNVTLVGWSLGFSITMAYLDLYGPRRLAGLVLVEGSPKLISDDEWDLGFCDLSHGVRTVSEMTAGYDTFDLETLFRHMYNEPESDADLPELLAIACGTDPVSTSALLWNHLTQDWRDVLPRIPLSTVVVGGTKSRIVGWQASEYIADAIPQARLELFDGAGHALQREEPDRFNTLVRQFVTGL
jgi:pimeloyl-ACP methyl ester carboxylesterase